MPGRTRANGERSIFPYRTLRATLTHAQAEDLITKNPAVAVTLATVRRRRGKSWSSDEARKFLESARADEDPLYAAYALVQRS